MTNQLAITINAIKNKVTKLNIGQRIMFAILSCERQLRYCYKYEKESSWTGVEFLTELIRKVEHEVDSNLSPKKDWELLLRKCEDLANISEENNTSLFAIPSQNSIFAICNLVDFIQRRDEKDLLQISQFGFSSVDYIVQMKNPKLATNANLNDEILHHPLMQAEIAAQENDIAMAKQESLTKPWWRKLF